MYVKALNIKRLLQEPKFNLANELNCRHYCIPGERPESIYTHYSANIYVCISLLCPRHPALPFCSLVPYLRFFFFIKVALNVNNVPQVSSISTAGKCQLIINKLPYPPEWLSALFTLASFRWGSGLARADSEFLRVARSIPSPPSHFWHSSPDRDAISGALGSLWRVALTEAGKTGSI